jgi:xanthine/CO dehydrogenase XdhC/CoxF family maturation factor
MKGFQEIVATIQSLAEPAALATLVRVKGSSYRQPGARMVFGPAGIRTGVISAGCLETDILARAGEVLDGGGAHLAPYDLGSDLDLVWGTGMGCQGRADVLLERVTPGPVPEWMDRCSAILGRRGTGALATVFAARGETGGLRPGDHFLADEAGPGLRPGPGPFAGLLESALDKARSGGVLATPTLEAGTGELDLLVEPILPPYALWIFGAGEHSRPIVRLAKELGWFVGIVDHRPALATPERFPQADRIIVGHPPGSLPVAYLGLQGNRARSRRLVKDLEESGLPLTGDRAAKLRFPAGLDIGAETPETIALSMLAEVQAALSGHPGGPLRDRGGRIHN